MPLHDWARLDPDIFHDFHVGWIAELRRALNGGVLPAEYYALAEPAPRAPRRRRLAIYHAEGHRVVALIELGARALASYRAGVPWVAHVRPLAVGEALGEMPLYLTPDFYVNVPL